MKLFLFLIFVSWKAYAETQVFEAVARNEERIVYFERHIDVYDQQTLIKSLIEYLDPEGKLIGTMKSDFTHNIAAPEFVLRDLRQKSFQGVTWRKGKLETFSREGAEARVGHKLISGSADEIQVAGPGLIYFVGTHLKELIHKGTFDFQYIIPGRLEAFDFYIKTLAHNDETAEFEVRMKSWLMRLFGPRTRLIYNIQKKRLIFFQGQSNLRNRDGQMMGVEIQYKYNE